jgi:predicted hydrolase (HD superfamily)
VTAGIGRLELFIVLRTQLADRALVRRALAVEAVMEELAREVGADAALWGLAGLGCDIDAKLTAGNLARRGAVAEELLLTEGVAPEAAAAARRYRDEPVESLPAIARGLVVAALLVELVAAELAEARLDELADGRVAHRLRRLARRGDEPRALAALAALGLDADRAAAAATAAHLRVREDLGL